MRLCSCIWGGRYNPIIPYCEGAQPRGSLPFERVSTAFDIPRRYIEFFEPDILVETEPGIAERLGWSSDKIGRGLKRLISLDEFYTVDDRGDVEFAAGIDIVNVMQELYDKEYKYQRRHKIPFADVAISTDDAFFEAVIGCYAEDTALAYINDAYQEVFEPESLPCSAETSLKIMRENFAGPNWISRHGLEEDLGRGGRDHTIHIFDPSDAGDVIDYWNYRLIQRQVTPVSIKWVAEHATLLCEQITKVHRPYQAIRSARCSIPTWLSAHRLRMRGQRPCSTRTSAGFRMARSVGAAHRDLVGD